MNKENKAVELKEVYSDLMKRVKETYDDRLAVMNDCRDVFEEIKDMYETDDVNNRAAMTLDKAVKEQRIKFNGRVDRFKNAYKRFEDGMEHILYELDSFIEGWHLDDPEYQGWFKVRQKDVVDLFKKATRAGVICYEDVSNWNNEVLEAANRVVKKKEDVYLGECWYEVERLSYRNVVEFSEEEIAAYDKMMEDNKARMEAA